MSIINKALSHINQDVRDGACGLLLDISKNNQLPNKSLDGIYALSLNEAGNTEETNVALGILCEIALTGTPANRDYAIQLCNNIGEKAKIVLKTKVSRLKKPNK